MKKTLAVLTLALTAPFIWSQTTTTKTEKTTSTSEDGSTQTTTTTSTTTGSGTITEYVPGKTIVLKEAKGPRTYTFGDKVVYVDHAGKPIPEGELKARIKVGEPVRVHYMKGPHGMVVSRVVVGE